MSASYPYAIKDFSTKYDFTDDVMAAHVNDLQNEVVALESILGVNPHLMNADDVNNLVQQDILSVSQRLDALEAGMNKPAFTTMQRVLYMQTVATDLTTNGTAAVLPAPLAGCDPFGWYNGSGFTIQKTGWYSLVGGGGWMANATVGHRRIAIGVNGAPNGGTDYYGPAPSPFISTTASWIGVLTAGSTVGIRLAHNCATSQIPFSIYVGGTYLRGI